jgi:tRNA-modifying protein YgfZ
VIFKPQDERSDSWGFALAIINMCNEYQAATEGVALFDLSQYGKIELAGRDARSFLNNLCTQDVTNLSVGTGCEAFLTTNKARVVAHVWITQREENILWLDMVAGLAEKVLKHLNHYLISEQVELTDRTGEFTLLRLVGPKTSELLSGLAIPPSRRHSLLALDAIDLFCPIGACAALRQRLVEGGAVPAGSATYQILRIEAGLPEYGIDIDENRLAMEVGRTAVAICYTKGCFLGQETIVMARDRGQVNRSLMGVKVRDGEPLAPGTKLFRADEEVGQVTSSVLSPRLGQVIALAYLRRGSWDAGTELAIDPTTDGRTAVVCALPFCSGGDRTLP